MRKEDVVLNEIKQYFRRNSAGISKRSLNIYCKESFISANDVTAAIDELMLQGLVMKEKVNASYIPSLRGCALHQTINLAFRPISRV